MVQRTNLKPVRIPTSIWNQIKEIAKLQKRNTDGRGPRTHLANEMITAAVAKWLCSPYVCSKVRHVALVTADGDVFFRTVQQLYLNDDRLKLPCVVQMKPEKRDDYFGQHQGLKPQGLSRGEWLESRWIINHFAAWQEGETQNAPLVCAVDRLGIESKMVDMPLPNLNGSLTREIVVGWREYVQWQETEMLPETPKYDRLAFNIDIPTTDFGVLVFVDENLYPRNQGSPHLDIEFRNRERAKFKDKEVVTSFGENRYEVVTPSEGTIDDRPSLIGPIEELLKRLRELADSTIDDLSIVTDSDRALIKSLRTPKRFLRLEMVWPSPHWGIQVGVRWKKPIRTPAEKTGTPVVTSNRRMRRLPTPR